MLDDLVAAVTAVLLPWLPVLAITLYLAVSLPDAFPRPRRRRHVRQRRALAQGVEAWPSDARTLDVPWWDHGAMPKDEIIALLGGQGWFYAGQDVRAHGWPLHFTRDRAASAPVTVEPASVRPPPKPRGPADTRGALAALLILTGLTWILIAIAFFDAGPVSWTVFVLTTGCGAVLTVQAIRQGSSPDRGSDP